MKLNVKMLVLFFALLMGSGAALQPSWAASSVFEVRDVFVDVTAENVTQARARAMRQAQEEALSIVLKRVTSKQDHELLPWVEPKQRANYIRDFSVENEKTSAVRYLATLTFHFKPEEIRKLLQSRNLSFSETQSKAVLYLPLYEDRGRLTIWEEPNPWAQAWRQKPTDHGLVPIALPLGDLEDIGALTAQQAFDTDSVALQTLIARYGTNGAIVTLLRARALDSEGQPTAADLIITRVGREDAGRSTAVGLQAQAGESSAAFLERLADATHDQLEESWKQANQLNFGSLAVLPVNLSITQLQQWLTVKQKLSGVAVVRQTEVALLSRDLVQLNLHYLGSLDQLIGALQQVDLGLSVQGESWYLQPR